MFVPMGFVAAGLLAVVACGALYALARRPSRRRPRSTRELTVELRRMTHDPEVATRLIERMQRRHPRASEAAVPRFAIEELRADRRH